MINRLTPIAAKPGRVSVLRLRPTLLTTVVGLVLLTALAIGGSAAVLMMENTRTLIDQIRRSAVATTTQELRQFFDVAPRITAELSAEARRGGVSLDRPQQLAVDLAERLRVQPGLAWIGYADVATGRYVAATRYGSDEIVQYVADPRVDGGVPEQVAVAANGTTSPPTVVEKAPYLVLEKPWFKHGIGIPGPIWSAFYDFGGGGRGITCMDRYTAPGAAAPTGLFNADLRVDEISRFLSTLRIGRHGAVFLVDRDGHRVASPHGGHVAAAAAALDAAADRRATATIGAPARIDVGGRRYEAAFAPTLVTGDPGLIVAVIVDLGDITNGLIRHAAIAGAIGFGVALLAILLGALLSSRIARPVASIADDLATVGAFQISQRPSPQSFVREISDLGIAVDRMKASLRSFGHYVPTDLVRTLLSAGREAELGGEIRRMTIHFSDVADFTSISEGMTPTALVAATGGYFEMMTAALTRHGGTVDKFMGDGIMAFFNAPEILPDHPAKACLAALEAQEALARMAAAAKPGDPVFHARIGLGFGDVLVGNIGTPERFAYTLLGDEVNLASRLEGLNKVYGTRIMATDALAAETGDRFEWRLLDRVAVKGRHQGTLVRELLGRRGAVAADILSARDDYERALERYFAGDFAAAATLFSTATVARADDLAAATMRDRSRDLAASPPDDWTGIHVMHQK